MNTQEKHQSFKTDSHSHNCGHHHDTQCHKDGCSCGHSHGETENSSKRIIILIIGALFFIIGWLLPTTGYGRIIVFLISLLITGGNVLWEAIKNILKGHVFDENFLMSIASIGAFAIGEYPEGAAVMLFYQIGELFQDFAVSRSRRSISSLMDIRPDYANVTRNGTTIRVSPEEVQPDEVILVKPGEKIPLDGVVLSGSSFLDTSALTGESVPRKATIDDEVRSGCINQTSPLTIKVTRPFAESTVSKILNLVENASEKKAEAEHFISKFARYYTPIVVGCAFLLAVLPPLILGESFAKWFYRALTFLVISCPCALVISIPLSFFGGIGGASKAGVLVKGGNFLEALAHTDTVVFDKTGTLTKGIFEVTQIEATDGQQERLLTLAALAESYSNHPIAQSIRRAYQKQFGKEIDAILPEQVSEQAGHGIQASIDGKSVLVGNRKLLEQAGISCPEILETGTVVYCAENGNYLGYLLISDQIRKDAKQAISQLKAMGIHKTVMLTGDSQKAGNAIAKELGLDKAYTELLPDDKVCQIEKLIFQQGEKKKTVFVGDGINDAPVLARADIGIAMGGIGSDAAIEAADIVIMTDEPSKIPLAIRHARRTLVIVKQNIVFALSVKLLVLLLGAAGIATMWAAVFADVGVAVIAILNAIRALKQPK